MTPKPESKEMPSEEMLEKWASSVMDYSDHELQNPEVAEFLRSPRLRTALDTLEAVEWLTEAARHEGASIHIATAGRGFTVHAMEAGAHGETLPEAVQDLRSRLDQKKKPL